MTAVDETSVEEIEVRLDRVADELKDLHHRVSDSGIGELEDRMQVLQRENEDLRRVMRAMAAGLLVSCGEEEMAAQLGT